MNIEEFVFNTYKKQVVYYTKFKKKMIEQYKMNEDQIKRLANRIWDYQKEKYGDVLDLQFESKNKEEYQKLSMTARARKNNKKRYREGRLNKYDRS